MNNHALIPTNINDFTDSLSLTTRVVYVYGCITQCDSWGCVVNSPDLIANKLLLPVNQVEKAYKDLEATGLILYIANRGIIIVKDFVMWNAFKFLKANDKKTQWHKEVQVAIDNGILPQGYLELPYIAVRKKKNFLKSLGLQDEGEVEGEVDSKDKTTKIDNTKGIYTSTSTSNSVKTSDSESISDSSSANKDLKDLAEEDLPF